MNKFKITTKMKTSTKLRILNKLKKITSKVSSMNKIYAQITQLKTAVFRGHYLE